MFLLLVNVSQILWKKLIIQRSAYEKPCKCGESAMSADCERKTAASPLIKQRNLHRRYNKHSDVHLKLAVVSCQLFLLLQLLFELLQFGHRVEWRNGHSWNLGQTAGWSPGDRRVPAVQEELSVVNDPGSWRRESTLITPANHMVRKMHMFTFNTADLFKI